MSGSDSCHECQGARMLWAWDDDGRGKWWCGAGRTARQLVDVVFGQSTHLDQTLVYVLRLGEEMRVKKEGSVVSHAA